MSHSQDVGPKLTQMFLPSLLQFRVVGRRVIIILQHDTLSFQTAALWRHPQISINQIQYSTNITRATVGTYESESCISDSSHQQTFGFKADEEKKKTGNLQQVILF